MRIRKLCNEHEGASDEEEKKERSLELDTDTKEHQNLSASEGDNVPSNCLDKDSQRDDQTANKAEYEVNDVNEEITRTRSRIKYWKTKQIVDDDTYPIE
jgi:hypothetical protein